MRWVMQAVLGIRQIRGEMDIAPRAACRCCCSTPAQRDLALAQRHRSLLIAPGGTRERARAGAG